MIKTVDKNKLIEQTNKIDTSLYLADDQVVGLIDSDGNFSV
jgi:hypothetical protein